MNGGQRLRFDVLRQYAQAQGMVQRLNAYVTFDAERAKTDREYGDRTTRFHDVIRDLGYHTTVKEVQWFYDPDSRRRYGKANADMDIAIDLINQAKNLDTIVLLTGDGDFVRPVQHVRDMGCRVEVIGFDNVSQNLRKEADTYLSGYLIPELIPTNRRDTPWGTTGSTVRGFCYYHQDDESFGFMAYMDKVSSTSWITDPRHPESPYKAVFFHDSALPESISPRDLPSRRIVLEFEIVQGEKGLIAEELYVPGTRSEQKPMEEYTPRSMLDKI
jgi:uncharacterized LabA/DUF88 family protein